MILQATPLARQAYEMTLSGHDAYEISEALAVTVVESQKLAEEYGASIPSPSNTEARRDEIKRCDVWLQRVDAEYIQRTIPIDKAVNSFVKLSERRCKLLGLDAPTRSEIEATLHAATPSDVDAEIRQLTLDLGINDPSILVAE